MVEIVEEIAHVQGHPKKLIVFLHGYIDSADALERTISEFVANLDDCAVHMPQAPIPCEVHERKRQWYSMHRFDPDDIRKTVPTLKECTEIYNKMALGFSEALGYLNPYIDNLLNEYQLEDKDLYICGFSQGAMLALYAALMRDKPVAGCVSFSGILAPYRYVMKNYKSPPPFLLIHGDADNLVRFEALDFTKKQLKKIGCPVETCVIKGGQHRITPDGLAEAYKFINSREMVFREKAAG